MGMSLAMLAVRHGCELRGDPDTIVDHVATLAGAGPGALAFLANPRYRTQLAATRASVVVLDAESAAACPVACLVSGNPYLSYAGIAAELHPPPPLRPGVAAQACVAGSAVLGAGTQVDAGAVVGEDARIGERVLIGANAVVGAGCVIGDDSRIMPGAILYDRVRVGRRSTIHANAVIGADGFGNARGPGGVWTKVPQVGGVSIGDDVEIGALTSVDRGAIGDTTIGNGVRLDNQIQIGHNVVIGEHTAMAAQAGVSGSTRIGARCIIAGRVAFTGHLSIADDVVVTGGANVTHSIDKPGIYSGAIPAEEARSWRKNAVRFGQLDAAIRRLQALEAAQRGQDEP